MSSGVSQIEYWRDSAKPKQANETSTAAAGKGVTAVKEGGPGAIYLSYDVFLGLSIVGGLLALDHLYLRSPMTFVAKIVVNVLFLGAWWIYDASQAVFNKDVVKVFGLGIPGLGPQGIGAGVLGSDVPDKKHMAFFIYGLAVVVGGIVGLDSFLVGDKQSGLIRLVSLLSGVLAPIAVAWWLYNLMTFIFKTKDVTNMYWQYFGAPEPAEHGMTLGEKLAQKFPFIQKLFGPFARVKNAVVGTAEGVIGTAEALGEGVLQDPIGTAKGLAGKAVSLAAAPVSAIEGVATKAKDIATSQVGVVKEKVGEALGSATSVVAAPIYKAKDTVTSVASSAIGPAKALVESAAQPVLAAAGPLKNTVDKGLDVSKEGIQLGETIVQSGTTIATEGIKTVGEVAKSVSGLASLITGVPAMAGTLTPASAQQALDKMGQTGGNLILQQETSSNVLSYALVGTIAIIAVSGLILTYRRFRQNGQPEKNDAPPEPGVLRESDKKEPSKTT
jgi:hypothetical protein